MIVWDFIDPAELTEFVRDIDPATYGFTLDEYLPNTTTDENEFKWRESSAVRVRAAGFRAWDVVSPLLERPGFSSKSVELAPLSMARFLSEKDRILKQIAINSGQLSPGLEQTIYDDAAATAESVLARMELARGELLATGTIPFHPSTDEGYTDDLVLDFGVPNGNFLDSTVDWSNPTNSKPISDMIAWKAAYKAGNTMAAPPAQVLTSDIVVQRILASAETKSFFAQFGITPNVLVEADLTALFTRLGLPPIRTYETQVNVDGALQRVIPDNLFIMLPAAGPRFGQSIHGITAESLELVTNSNVNFDLSSAPGLTSVVIKRESPVSLETNASAVFMPVLKDPKLLFVCDTQGGAPS